MYFYPRDNTPGCTLEGSDFRDLAPAFRRARTRILGISTDTLESHGRFKDKMKFPFELGSDEDHAVAALFGVWKEKNMYGRKMMGIERSTFLIDAKGGSGASGARCASRATPRRSSRPPGNSDADAEEPARRRAPAARSCSTRTC